MPCDKNTFTLDVEYNPPGFHPVSVFVKQRISAHNSYDNQEFHGNKLKTVLKEAMKSIETYLES